MTVIRLSTALFVFGVMLGCQSASLVRTEAVTSNATTNTYDPADDYTNLAFTVGDVQIKIDYLSPFDSNAVRISGDTMYIGLELGEVLAGRRVRLQYPETMDVRIGESYVNRMIVREDSIAYSLDDWKFYQSQWKDLAAKSAASTERSFVIPNYQRRDENRFPEFDTAELVHYARANLSKEIVAELEQPTKGSRLSFGVWMDTHLLKLSVSQLGQTQPRILYLAFEIPHGGC